MFEFRPFLNVDPPALAEVWRSQPPLRGLAQPMSARLLEVCVFAKQYFDPEGFIVATRNGEPVGFAHAGFGPDERGSRLSTEVGATQMLMVRGDLDEPALADELLFHAEEYLRRGGAERLFGGGARPISQFYLGLYGGAELPGVLDSDVRLRQVFERNGYEPVKEFAVVQRDLAGFRPAVSRSARRLRREVNVVQCQQASTDTWWDASERPEQEVIRFEAAARGGGAALAGASFWDIEPLGTSWGVPTIGVIDLEVAAEHRRQGVATYLLAEAFRELRVRGATMVEAMLPTDNEPIVELCKKMGLSQVDRGRVYCRGTADP